MNYFKLKNKQMPWDDYGEVLFAGCCGFSKAIGQFSIERTAPFVPSIWRNPHFAWLFATDAMKRMLEKSGLRGLSFRPAVKTRIVSLAWEKWDLSAPEPEIYPSGDMDAEEYIVRRKHNQQLSDEMGEIWAVIPAVQGIEFAAPNTPVALVARSLGDADVFVAANKYSIDNESIYVSEKARDWLSKNGNGVVRFDPKPAPIKEVSKQQLEAIHAGMEYRRLCEEKSAAMTDADWRKWHRLTRGAEKLAKERLAAKSAAAKIRRTNKAVAMFLEAREMYPLNPEDTDSETLAELINEQNKNPLLNS